MYFLFLSPFIPFPISYFLYLISLCFPLFDSHAFFLTFLFLSYPFVLLIYYFSMNYFRHCFHFFLCFLLFSDIVSLCHFLIIPVLYSLCSHLFFPFSLSPFLSFCVPYPSLIVIFVCYFFFSILRIYFFWCSLYLYSLYLLSIIYLYSLSSYLLFILFLILCFFSVFPISILFHFL